MTERRKRVEELLDAEIAKGGSGMDCHIRACLAFADAEVAAVTAQISRALMPDPNDEREVSIDWLRKEIRKAIEGKTT